MALVVLMMLVVVAIKSVVGQTCDGATTYVSSSGRFIAVDCLLSWQDANSYCASTFGTSLGTSLSLVDDEEMSGICGLTVNENSAIANNYEICWWGLNDIDVADEYVWVENGVNIVDTGYVNWHPLEPSSAHECGLIGTSTFHSDTSVRWWDWECHQLNAFVCNYDSKCDDSQDIMCYGSGDVHISSFDGQYYHYMGEGYYDYVAPCDDTVFMPFVITGNQKECPPWDPYTCLFDVLVSIDDGMGTVISFPSDGSDPTYVSDGMSAVGNHAFSDGSYTVAAESFSGMFTDPTTGDEVTISFEYRGYSLKITTSSDCMDDRICGLCGAVNGDSSDDFTKRDGNVISNEGSEGWPVDDDIWDNVNEFGDSWCNDDLTNNPNCDGSTTDVDQPDINCLNDALSKCEYVWSTYCSDCSSDELNYNEWLLGCQFDACAASNDNLGDYIVNDAINNGFFDAPLDACSAFCNDVSSDDFVTDCWVCPDICDPLTSEYGCKDNQCLDTCANCVSDIPWNDYENGQNNNCQCHNNGCDQCQDGFFKVDYDFPCQSCDGLIGCLHCSDFYGCQQCEDGYTMVEHPHCGDNSNLNTGNTKLHYCVPTDGSECRVGDVIESGNGDGGGCPSVTECLTNPCDCDEDANCDDCQSWGCNKCSDGYYKPSFGHFCVKIDDNFGGNCIEANDWSGCTKCDNGFSVTWDNNCSPATNICA